MPTELKIRPNLTGVPETMLWTLHNRATESMRPDSIMKDKWSEEIYHKLDYDYETVFGPGHPSHSLRSIMFDRYLSAFLGEHPDGVIVNLGEGLETQRFRFDQGKSLWFSVDLPEAIAIRERFFPPDEHHLHLSCSAFSSDWHSEIPTNRPLYITAQGLLMYMEEEVIRDHFIQLAERFPGAWYAFDTIPRWLSKKTTREKGYKLTEHFTAPPCPWGINRAEIQPTLRRWVPSLDQIILDDWDRYPRGFQNRYLFWFFSKTPGLRRFTPTVNRIRFGVF